MNGAMLRRAAAGAVLSGVGAVATLGLGVFGYAIGVAQADIRCDPVCHGTWCPGEPVLWQIRYLAETWDPNVWVKSRDVVYDVVV